MMKLTFNVGAHSFALEGEFVVDGELVTLVRTFLVAVDDDDTAQDQATLDALAATLNRNSAALRSVVESQTAPATT